MWKRERERERGKKEERKSVGEREKERKTNKPNWIEIEISGRWWSDGERKWKKDRLTEVSG